MAENWSQVEVELIVADYFSMLSKEIGGVPFNKTEHRGRLLPLLNNRNEGSVEFKHANISAFLNEIGVPYIRGYKPRENYQRSLLPKVVLGYIEAHPELEEMFTVFATNGTVDVKNRKVEFEKFVEAPPEKKSIVLEPGLTYRRPVRINYLEMEQANRLLGLSGEEIALNFERWRLQREGKDSLAEQIEWVSRDRGDGLGYDILSRNSNGTDRYIEVKSTKLTKEAPIFFSKNEYEFAKGKSSNFHLYRVFNLKDDPKMFMVNGAYDEFCVSEPVKYKGYF
jgi:hypothetical protein